MTWNDVKYLFGVAVAAAGMCIAIRYGLKPGNDPSLLFWRGLGLVDVCFGAWLIQGSFK